MSISAITNNALSGMQAQTKRLATTASNVANVNTRGYSRLETQFSSSASGGVSATVLPSSISGASSVDLAEEVLDTVSAEIGFKANAKVFEAGADLWDVLMSIKRD